ncbi:MAG TPA: N,N-dimethylformamidase beta subunit family domain-containing protein, partial [Candidatus Nanopelagicaceae bacterium]
DNSKFIDSTCPTLSPTWVKDENQKPGVNMTTADWKNLDLSFAEGSALWLNQTSVSCGAIVKIHAALYKSNYPPAAAGPRTFAAWRIGYYNGSGARQVWRSRGFILKEGKATTSKAATRYTEARWPVTTTFTVGNDWTPGFYLILTLSPFGVIENAAPLIVRSPIGSSKLVMMQSFFTWQMYNSFGGRSAYLGPDKDGLSDSDERSRISSFDRPMLGSGAYSIQRDAIPFIQFTEEHGINIDQVNDFDINQWPSITTKYSGVIIGGHAEYFTHRIFNTFVADRNLGTNIAIFGGNTAYWQTRLTASKIGPNRRMVMYRNATEDPTTNLNLVSIEFANKRINTPPNLISGEQTNGVHVYGTLKPMGIPTWLHVKKSATISGVSSDSEVEATTPNKAQPPNVHVLYSGVMSWRDPVRDKTIKNPPIAQVDWIGFASGSAVFNAGMSTWSCQLSDTCVDLPYSASSQTLIRSITLQVLSLWQHPKIGASLK